MPTPISRGPGGRGEVVLALLLGVPLLAGCSGGADSQGRVARTGTTASSLTAPILQPGRPGEANTTVTGTAAPTGPSPSANAADVQFLKAMVVHHAQAVVMVRSTAAHLTDSKVRALAARIGDVQPMEMSRMAQMLHERGADVPPQAANPLFAMGTDHEHMAGMASRQQLAELAAARGVVADRLFLQLMIAHHRGALQMAATRQGSGTDELVEELGDDISVTQTVEIARMQGMLDRLS